MPNLVSLLGTAANGLAAFQVASNTAGHNMQNVNTPGFARQRVELATQRPDYQMGTYIGRGVLLAGVSQSRDAFLERQIPTALGSSARYAAESGILQSVGVLDPESVGSVTEALGKFYSDLRALSQNPGEAGLRTAVVGAARNLALTFNRVGNALEDAREGIDARVVADVAEVNDTAKKLASLNKQIQVARSRGADPNDLLDERLRVRDKLAELTGAVPVPDGDGNISMVLSSGLALVSGGEAATVSTTPDTSNDGHLTITVTRIGAQAPDGSPIAAAFGGTIRGLLDARDGTLRRTLSELDTMAFDFGTAFNSQHRAGFDLDGNAGGDFFNVGTTTAVGASRTISIDAALSADARRVAAAATATTVPGDPGNLHALINLERAPLSTGNDPAGTLASIISSFGASARSAKAVAEQDASVANHLTRLREATSGVSLDEEMVALTQAQRAFEAVTKVITVTDQLLGVLMDLK